MLPIRQSGGTDQCNIFELYLQIVGLKIPMQNEIEVKILESLECHNGIRFDIGRCEHNLSVFDDILQIRVHEIKHQRNIRFVAEHVQQTDQIFVLQFV